MAFIACKSLMERCAVLLLEGAAADETGLLGRCAAGLQNLAAHAEIYDEQVQTCRDFAAHLEQELRLLPAVAEKSLPQSGAHDLAAVWDTAFILLEDLVVLSREKVLRTGFTKATGTERSLLRYFETSGYWKAGDGTLVAEAYYVTLPATVLHQMLMRVTPGVEEWRSFSGIPATETEQR